MKQHSTDAILTEVDKIWAKDRGRYDHFKIEVHKNTDKLVRIQIDKMYESPSLSLAHLLALAEFFGTKNITDPCRFSNGGCETCDYGSSYGFTLEIKPEGE